MEEAEAKVVDVTTKDDNHVTVPVVAVVAATATGDSSSDWVKNQQNEAKKKIMWDENDAHRIGSKR